MSRQRGVFCREQAIAAGHERAEVDRLLRAGEWVRLRHGVYTTAAMHASRATDERLAHLLAGAARMLVTAGDVMLSHESAAVFHGIGLLQAAPDEPVLTRHRTEAGGRLTAHGLYVASVPTAHRVRGVPVTAAARSVADCARALDREAAFVTVESALHLGLDRVDVIRVLRTCAGWPGVAEARDLLMLANSWSESPLESLARLWFRAQGLPQPLQQRRVLLGQTFLGRVDFLWPQYRTVCEVDGRLKYDPAQPATAVYPPDEQTRDALFREKVREDMLRDAGAGGRARLLDRSPRRWHISGLTAAPGVRPRVAGHGRPRLPDRFPTAPACPAARDGELIRTTHKEPGTRAGSESRGKQPRRRDVGATVTVLLLVLAATTVAGLVWRRRQGRLSPTTGRVDVLAELGEEPGTRATLLQFSSAFCAPCRATKQILGDVARAVPGVRHVEVDAEAHLDVVRRLNILKTPTTLVLDGRGRVTQRASGQPRKEQILDALEHAVG